MTDYFVQGLVLVFLLLNSYVDWKKREISPKSLLFFGAVGILLNIFWDYQSAGALLTGAGVGIFLILAAFLTKEAIGFGDGLLICVTGIYLGGAENLALLLAGLVLCGGILGLGVLLHRTKWKERVPLVPFLAAAYVGRLAAGWLCK